MYLDSSHLFKAGDVSFVSVRFSIRIDAIRSCSWAFRCGDADRWEAGKVMGGSIPGHKPRIYLVHPGIRRLIPSLEFIRLSARRLKGPLSI